jgi:hypothetical protein
MNNPTQQTNKQQAKTPSAKNVKKGVENHATAARHFEEAAKKHKDAERYLEQGKHEEHDQSAINAIGHASLGQKAQKAGIKLQTKN